MREEPADDHVGPGDVPGRHDDRRPRQGRRSRSATSAARRTWTTSPARASCPRTRSTAPTTARRRCSSPTRARSPSRASARPSRTSTRTRSPDWMKPVKYQYINDAGWDNYAESIATKPENITKYADCFKKLVPIIQQADGRLPRRPGARPTTIILDAVEAVQQRLGLHPGRGRLRGEDDEGRRPRGQRSRRRGRQVRRRPGQRPDHQGHPDLHRARTARRRPA